jgi:t-SNARE complex subunit (syntaxin)
MNQIVIEQGTIVDRIDYNLEQSVDNVVKAKKELVQVIKSIFCKKLIYLCLGKEAYGKQVC